jgi:hypothetical protein
MGSLEPRRRILAWIALGVAAGGCRAHQYGHVIDESAPDLVGSHRAGAEVYNPLVDEAVAKLLARCVPDGPSAAGELPPPAAEPPYRVCFLGVENKSIEELGDFKEQLYEQIDAGISQAPHFRPVSRRLVEAALRETRLHPDAILLPDNRAAFATAVGRQGEPIDYLLYARITSGTTERNHSTQRDYLLTLEMINVRTGDYAKESAELSKGYHKTRLGKWWHYNPLKTAAAE